MDDAKLLGAWCAGDRKAGQQLVELHFVSVYRFFRNKVDGDLDDLVQTTFARCVERVDDAEIQAFRPYLFGVARNVLREYYRRRRSEREVDGSNASVADLGASPSAWLREKREHRLLLEALRRIPLDDQVLLELVYWESLTGPQVGAVLGVPEGTARTRLRSARLSLEAALHELSRSPGELQSTLDNLQRWSEAIRRRLVADLD